MVWIKYFAFDGRVQGAPAQILNAIKFGANSNQSDH